MSEENRVLVFPKGTIVKFDGIPCELLQDTPYESETFRNRGKQEVLESLHSEISTFNGPTARRWEKMLRHVLELE